MDDLNSPLPEHVQPVSMEELLTHRAAETRRVFRRQMRRWYIIAAVLFVLTCLSTFSSGQMLVREDSPDRFQAGLLYSAGLMGILLAHELGHFLQSLRYRVPATPPLFIPMPLAFTGTMGAVIVQGGGFANRRALFDIAVSGPLAGLVVAIPVAWFGVQQSVVEQVSTVATSFGDPLILKWMIEYHHGKLPPGTDVILNPLLFAGWVGIFITALNLIPIGQLDGGHILYTLLGRRSNQIVWLIVLGVVSWMLMTANWSYLPFLILILFLGRGPGHPPSADDSVPLGAGRTILGWLTLSFMLIGFTPRPISFSEPEEPPKPAERESVIRLHPENRIGLFSVMNRHSFFIEPSTEVGPFRAGVLHDRPLDSGRPDSARDLRRV